jgi:hypothetical protein
MVRMAVSPATLARRRAHAWEPPPDLLAAAQADTWHGDPQPADPAQRPIGAGVHRLERYVRAKWPALVWVAYDRGPHPDEPHAASMHYAGRAFDAMVHPLAGGLPDRRGDEVANWLLARAKALGIQYLIWSGTQWSSATGRTSVYPGGEDHFNHVHVDMTEAGARGELAWPPAEDTGVGAGTLLAVGAVAVGAYWWLTRGKGKARR